MNKDIKEITEQLKQGVKDVFASDKYKEYLDFMGKFHDYSVNNIILIMMQKPDATFVAGYKAWQTKFNRQVRKGEKSLTIIAPCPHKKKIIDDNGEERDIIWNSFRTVSVFDISQTDGEEIPSYINKLDGDVNNFEILFKKLQEVSPVKVIIDDIKGNANGYFRDAENVIVVKKGMSEQQTIKTTVHEIAHAFLHNKDGEEYEADRQTREVQAESIAYVVCNMLGLDTAEYSFGYIAGWSKDKEAEELNKSMEVIRKTANMIIDRVKK